MFWGLFFLVVGLIIIVQTIFKIDLPVLRILFGCLLIYWGVKVLFGSFGLRMSGFQFEKVSTDTESAFSETAFRVRNPDGSINRRFSSAFSSTTIDLRDLKLEEMDTTFKIESGFSAVKILTPSAVPIKALVSSGLAKVKIRGQKVGSIGETEFQSPGYIADQPHIKLQIEVGFGDVVVE